jgi:hypothetical protein
LGPSRPFQPPQGPRAQPEPMHIYEQSESQTACLNMLRQSECRFGIHCKYSHDPEVLRLASQSGHAQERAGSRRECMGVARAGICTRPNCTYSHPEGTHQPRAPNTPVGGPFGAQQTTGDSRACRNERDDGRCTRDGCRFTHQHPHRFSAASPAANNTGFGMSIRGQAPPPSSPFGAPRNASFGQPGTSFTQPRNTSFSQSFAPSNLASRMTFPGNDPRNNAPSSPFNPPAGPRGGQGPRLPRQGQDNTWQARAGDSGNAQRLFRGLAAPRGPRNLDISLDDIVRERRASGGNQRGGGGGGGWRGGR